MNYRAPGKAVYVPAGQDRSNENNLRIWGLIPLANKLSTADTGGALYVFQHAGLGWGGPPRHVHHDQDEWFYVVQGIFAMEVGEEKLRLGPGDSVFAPRRIPHAWAHIADEPGSLITVVSPAGTFEDFLRQTTTCATPPSPDELAKAFAAHGMTVLGPPLPID